MPADEVTHGTDVEASTPVRTGPRHAAPKKPLFTRFHMPAGKAIALAAMPTAVLMGMGFTPTLANAEDQPTSKSLTIDEYKECVAALEDADASASASPSPSASASTDDAKDDKDSEGSKDSEDKGSDSATGGSKDTPSGSGGSSSDSGSDEEAEPAPSASSAPAASAGKPASSSGDTATATPSATETEKKNVLETIGDAIGDLFDGGKSADETPAPTETPSASAGTGDDATSDPGTGSSDSDPGSSGSGSSGGSGSAGESKDKDSKDSKDSKDASDTKDTVTEAVKDAAEDAADEATASPSASPSESADDIVDDCPVATLDESGVDNKTPIADDPWYLNASSLLLKGADYKGVVEVKTANGTKKKVLKYVISGGTDIGDLHQTVEDKQAGKTYHVQASSGSTSTIRDGDTIMYTQSISGNLFGLIPVTFDPDNPPPLNIPLIYFTKVKVVQAAQMGGNLHIPGMHVYTD
ncbi:hypothetical protein [Streptomyces antibioticus]|uniref:hypothetical protein n=1 Tax=Streptomyces antibioticus TaxID=1890 RepID=UPI0036DE6FB8